MKQRITYFDVFRGIGIFLIVFGHGNWNGSMGVWLHAFLMPLFFFIAGLFVDARTPWIQLVAKRFKRIMIPYFVFALLSFAYWYLLERHFRPNVEELTPWLEFVNIFYPMNMKVPDAFVFNVVLWFLPCMFLSTLMFDGLLRLGRRIWGQTMIIIGVVAVNVWCPPVEMPFYLSQALAMLPYMFLGFLVGRMRDRLAAVVQGNSCVALALSATCLIVGYLTAIPSDVRLNVYSGGYFHYLFVGAVLTIAVLVVSMVMRRDRFFEWLGLNSMAIMLIHDPIKRIAIVLVSKVVGIPVESVRLSNLWGLLVATIILSACAVILLSYRWVLKRLARRLKGAD